MSLFLLRLLYGMDAVVLLWAIIVAALEMLEVKPTLDCVTRTIDDPMDSTVGAQVNDSNNELPSCRLFYLYNTKKFRRRTDISIPGRFSSNEPLVLSVQYEKIQTKDRHFNSWSFFVERFESNESKRIISSRTESELRPSRKDTPNALK